jgi:hypothetical protein
MKNPLAILMIASGCILGIGSLALFDNAEVRRWYPAILIVVGVLVFWGIKKYRNT